MLAMLSNSLQAVAQEPEEHDFPIAFAKPELIDQLNATIHEMAARQEAAYFLAVLPNGRTLVVDKEGAEWRDMSFTGGFQGLGNGTIQYGNSTLDLRFDRTSPEPMSATQPNMQTRTAEAQFGGQSTTFVTCPLRLTNKRCCKSKTVALLPQTTLAPSATPEMVRP